MEPATIAALIGGTAATIGAGVQGLNWLTGRDIAEKNLALQQGTLDYQKAMQREAWGREDTAIQRRVADLKAAGLSPVLAAGQGASSSSPIQVTTPQREQYDLKFDEAQALALMSQAYDIARTVAETDRIKNETEIKRYDANYYRNMGLPSNATTESASTAETMHQIFGSGVMQGAAGAIGKKVADIASMIPMGKILQKAPVLQKIVVPAGRVLTDVVKTGSKFIRR